MRFICLGYAEEKKWDDLPQDRLEAMMEECFAYDDVLRSNKQFLGGEALQNSHSAKTLRWNGDSVIVTDGPFAETKEQLGGILILEANDMNHAIEIMKKHPGVRLGGPFEIRPADEQINELVAKRTRRQVLP
jgi:hypothetical protein